MTQDRRPRPSAAPTARTVAADVLLRVWSDQAFAAAALDAELGRAAQLEGRDAALATEIVLGSLRVGPFVEGRIGRHTRKGIASVDALVRAHLVVAAYQIFFLSRVPAFAAVNEAVTAVRRVRGDRVGAFANAVLRKLSAEAAATRPSLADAVAQSLPPWLGAALERALGAEGARAFVAASAEVPAVGLRVEDEASRPGWVERLRGAVPTATVEASSLSPLAVRVSGGGRLAALPGFAEGAWTPQEEGSQIVALALGAGPGERVLDACAGRGNKTAILARAVGPAGAVDAADLHAAKLERLRIELARVGLAPARTFAVDWSAGAGDAGDGYDAALVDAPCTGVGTLRRRPDLVLRRSPESLAQLSALQVAIAARVASRLRPGGRLVFAVCSVLREEGEDVVQALLAARPDLAPAPFAGAAARRLAGDGAAFRLLPSVHGTDGYFLASFLRRAGA